MPDSNQDNNQAIKQRYNDLFQLFENSLNGASKLKAHTLRQNAIKQLGELSFPSRRDEDWKYTSVTRIIEPAYQLGIPFEIEENQVNSAAVQGLEGIRLVFTNGVLDTKLSNFENLPDGLTIMRLDEAIMSEQFGAEAQSVLTDTQGANSNAFVAINSAFARNGIFIHAAKNKAIDQPIYLMHFNSGQPEKEMFTTPRIVGIAAQSSELTIVEHFIGMSEHVYFSNSVNRFHVARNGHLSYYKLQQEGFGGYQVTNSVAHQERDSTFSAYTIDLRSRITRNNLSAILKDSGTATNMFGVYLPTKDQHIDNQTFIDHAFPHCNSNELYKGVIKDKARGVFNGKVLVRQDAQKTNAFQQNSSLVLSEKAVMDTKPQLEIYADDVRCSHGATIGQLDEASVYYLKARGLTDDQARAMLQSAFVGEVIEKIPNDSIRAFVEAAVQIKLGEV